jgi:hypothetical protein
MCFELLLQYDTLLQIIKKFICRLFVESGAKVDVPEWLLGMTRNHVGFPRVGSNPTVHDF